MKSLMQWARRQKKSKRCSMQNLNHLAQRAKRKTCSATMMTMTMTSSTTLTMKKRIQTTATIRKMKTTAMTAKKMMMAETKATVKKSDSVQHTCFLILAAAGSSTRMGIGGKKEYLTLNSGTVLSESAAIFLKSAHLEAIVVTIPFGEELHAHDAFFADKDMTSLLGSTKLFFIQGGDTRQQSVFN